MDATRLCIHLVGFPLVGDQRVLLAEGAQPDALTQLVQVGQVAHPAVVDGAQHDQAFELAHHLGAHRGFFRVVGLLGQLDQMLGQFGGGELRQLSGFSP